MLQLVDRLPHKILSSIAEAASVRGGISDMGDVIRMTYVCRHWGESLISTPDHWRLISSKNKNLVAMILERSGAALLELWLNLNEIEDQPGFFDLIASYI